MSWRVILAILLLAAGASAWGGLQLGNWLVAHGPEAQHLPNHTEVAALPVLDADGKPFLAQPPQPLLDGRLAIPQGQAPVEWEIPNPDQSLHATLTNRTIQVSTTSITMVEAEEIASGGSPTPLQGIADVSNLGLGGNGSPQQPLQPVEMPPPPPPPSTAPPQDDAWKARLRQELQACSAQSFFERPTCAWAARNRYCEPNHAWGKVGDCPAKSF